MQGSAVENTGEVGVAEGHPATGALVIQLSLETMIRRRRWRQNSVKRLLTDVGFMANRTASVSFTIQITKI